IAMPATLVLVIAAPELFAFVFGESWRQAGEFARWMAPWLYMVFITSPLSTLFSIMERQRLGMLFQAGLLLVRALAIFVGASILDDLLLTVMLFAAVSALFWLGFLLWVCLASGNSLRAVLRPTLTAFTQATLCLLPLGLALHLVPTEQSWLMVGIGFSTVLLGAYYLNIFRKAHTS